MAWIEVHQSLPTHRKTLAVADALGIEPVAVVGHLTCLWLWALDNAPDGSLAGVGARTLARAAHWKRDAERFVAALTEAGFIEADKIHDWPDYAGRLLERRRRDAERKRTERGIPPDVPPPSNGRPPDNHRTSIASRAHITVPNPTVPDLTGDDSPFAATQRSPKGARRKRETWTDSDSSELVTKYRERFGSEHAVLEEIDAALNHTARFKALSERRYVDNWLRRECERRPPGRIVALNGTVPKPTVVDSPFAKFRDAG